MHCQKCGEQINPPSKFCPSCGHDLSTKAKTPLNQSQKWLFGIIGGAILVAIMAMILALSTPNPVDTIERQLNALQNEHITEAYYNYTAKSFQEASTLENFRQFVQNNPAFLHPAKIKFVAEHIEKNISTLDMILSSVNAGELLVQYQLVLEGDTWKILSIKPTKKIDHTQTADNNIDYSRTPPPLELALESDDNSHNDGQFVTTTNAQTTLKETSLKETSPSKNQVNKTNDLDQKPFLDAIQGQLTLIKNGLIEQAYNDYTSQSFQKSTDFGVFNDFVRNHAAFADNNRVEIEHVKVVNHNTVAVIGTLTASSGKNYPIDYHLILENGKWKILHIELTGDAQIDPHHVHTKTAHVEPLTFTKFIIGKALTPKGLVADPMVVFPQTTSTIHLNLYVNEAVSGTEIKISFEHLDTHSKAHTVTAIIPNDGEMILSFAFSPPSSGWPKGSYRITAQSSTGIKATSEFTVE